MAYTLTVVCSLDVQPRSFLQCNTFDTDASTPSTSRIMTIAFQLLSPCYSISFLMMSCMPAVIFDTTYSWVAKNTASLLVVLKEICHTYLGCTLNTWWAGVTHQSLHNESYLLVLIWHFLVQAGKRNFGYRRICNVYYGHPMTMYMGSGACIGMPYWNVNGYW